MLIYATELLRSGSNFFGLLRHLRGAFELVPGERPAVDGPLERLEQHQRKDLAIGEALQPDVEEQPSVAFVRGVAALEREGEAAK